MSDNRPRTHEALRALPIGPDIRWEMRQINGKPIRCPVMPDVVAIFHDEHDPISWVDEDGAWRIGRYADGTWFRSRA